MHTENFYWSNLLLNASFLLHSTAGWSGRIFYVTVNSFRRYEHYHLSIYYLLKISVRDYSTLMFIAIIFLNLICPGDALSTCCATFYYFYSFFCATASPVSNLSTFDYVIVVVTSICFCFFLAYYTDRGCIAYVGKAFDATI